MSTPANSREERFGGAVGAGLVLVVLPSVALFFGAKRLGDIPTVGLPILAIFGIMILFGALALTATLFARLHLDDRTQALGLPEGSIRAAIALSLIVLFAIIAILLNQTISKPVTVTDLSESAKESLQRDFPQRVLAVIPTCDANPGGTRTGDSQATDSKAAACPGGGATHYTVLLVAPVPSESTDLAKQLLVLIGTLMTSVVSFYFATRASEGKSAAGSSADSRNRSTEPEESDAQHGPALNPTADADLPAATGGVVS
jgi:hypothetical protein